MKLLALDTVSEACSVALWNQDTLSERYQIAPRQHTELILPMVDTLLQQADLKLTQLDALAVDQGPGSFTGVRIGISVVQGLAFSANLPVLAVSSLAALAHQAHVQKGYQQVLAMIDARMNEVYWGVYYLEDGVMQLQGNEQVGAIDTIDTDVRQASVAVGSGAQVYQTELADSRYDIAESLLYPTASAIVQRAVTMDLATCAHNAEEVQPVYLRNKVV